MASGRVQSYLADRYYESHNKFGGRKTFCEVDFYTLEVQPAYVKDV